MKMIKLYKLRGILIFSLLLLLMSPAFGIGADVVLTGVAPSGFGYDREGRTDSDKLTTASVVQWISGGIVAPTADFNQSNEITRFNVGEGNAGRAGTFYKSHTTLVGAAFLRIWENAAPARGGYYYRISAAGSAIDDPMPNPVYIASFNTTFIADTPPAPSIGEPVSVSYVERDVAGTSTLVGYAAIEVIADSKYELANVRGGKYGIQIRKKRADGTYPDWADPSVISKNGNSSPIVLNPDAVDERLDLGNTYQVRACARNYFSEADGVDNWNGDPGEPPYVEFTTAGMEGGIPTEFTFTLKASEPDRVVVNSIAVPSTDVSIDSADPNLLPAGPIARNVSTVKLLADAINEVAGAKVVTAVYKWDPVEAKGATFNDQGDVEDGNGDTEIVPGIGIQVYIKPGTSDIPITFTAQ